MSEVSDDKICATLLQKIWPLILEDSKCDIKTGDKPYFVPERKFDHIWANDFLACKNFGDYQPAIELKCPQQDEQGEQECQSKPVVKEIHQQPYRYPYIMPLDQQLALVEVDVERRKKLAKDFAERKYPWYIQRPSYECDFTINDEIRQLFTKPFEYEIIRKIQVFNCHLMLIDVAPDVPLKNMECWMKFAPYVAIVCIVHNEVLCKQLQNLNEIYHPVHMEEDNEGTWHDELIHAIEVGLNAAKKLYFFEDVSKPFGFVFANNRGICVFDKFVVLRKS